METCAVDLVLAGITIIAIGYLDFTYLAPAYAGLLLFFTGLLLCAIGL